MNPGWDTVYFVSLDPGEPPDRLGVAVQVLTSGSGAVPGCSFQPLGVKDAISDYEYSEATHRCIAPPTSIVLQCQSEDQLQFNGQTFRVMGVKTFWEHGSVHHVDVMCKWENG